MRRVGRRARAAGFAVASQLGVSSSPAARGRTSRAAPWAAGRTQPRLARRSARRAPPRAARDDERRRAAARPLPASPSRAARAWSRAAPAARRERCRQCDASDEKAIERYSRRPDSTTSYTCTVGGSRSTTTSFSVGPSSATPTRRAAMRRRRRRRWPPGFRRPAALRAVDAARVERLDRAVARGRRRQREDHPREVARARRARSPADPSLDGAQRRGTSARRRGGGGRVSGNQWLQVVPLADEAQPAALRRRRDLHRLDRRDVAKAATRKSDARDLARQRRERLRRSENSPSCRLTSTSAPASSSRAQPRLEPDGARAPRAGRAPSRRRPARDGARPCARREALPRQPALGEQRADPHRVVPPPVGPPPPTPPPPCPARTAEAAVAGALLPSGAGRSGARAAAAGSRAARCT